MGENKPTSATDKNRRTGHWLNHGKKHCLVRQIDVNRYTCSVCVCVCAGGQGQACNLFHLDLEKYQTVQGQSGTVS